MLPVQTHSKTLLRAVTCALGVFLVAAANAPANESIDFNRDIRPILSENCFHCHGPDAATRHADLRLDQPESAATVVVAGDTESSELITRILSDDEDTVMPPSDSNKSLSAKQKALLRSWVDFGATFESHWALERPKKTAPPAIDAFRGKNEIDAFVQHQLQRQGMKLSPAASKRTYIRRVTLDLTGLPPTPQQVEAFADDDSPDAVDRLIDRLMQSPHYGEQMTLPWLEAARYADTDGYQNDRYRYQYAWRDWVIDAFNRKLPYDQFIIDQIAGDMLPNATVAQQIATGFGRNHRINSEDGSIDEEWRVENVVDRVDTFGTVFLGLTVGCARCHDHKYDPISQREYYQLFAYFNNIAEVGVGPNNGNSPPFIDVPDDWPSPVAMSGPKVTPEPVKLQASRRGAGNGLRRPQPGSPETVMVMHELDQPRETYLLQRGVYNMPDKSETLDPAVPAALHRSGRPDPANRLELAQWLVAPENPLTARVVVNRTWQQFFGSGLVPSSDNFGAQGSPPTHPELLDYLAVDLIESGWDLQALQKKILTSATYWQTSDANRDSYLSDPENRRLGRGPRVRLDAFALRDQALALSGLLTNSIGGPSVKPYMPPKIWSSISNNKYKQDLGENLYRRSLYTYWRRTIPPPTMMSFNAAAREVCTVQTEQTNTPMQALSLLNNRTFVEAARVMAGNLLEQHSTDIGLAIRDAFVHATCRNPTDDEVDILQATFDESVRNFESDSQSAKQVLEVGDFPVNEKLSPPTHAALTMTISLILNLDETITKE